VVERTARPTAAPAATPRPKLQSTVGFCTLHPPKEDGDGWRLVESRHSCRHRFRQTAPLIEKSLMISEGGASTAFRLFAKPPPAIVVPGVFAVLSPSIMSFAARVSSQRRHRQGSCWLGGQSLFHPLGPLPPPLLPWTATAVPPGVVPSTDGSVHPGRVMLTPHHRLTWKSSPTHFRSQLRRSRHRVQLRAWPNKCAMKSR
jgi:hypothetical protein